MPSPFPGFNPYLEDSLFWEDVHAKLATEIRAQLQPRLLPLYVAILTPDTTHEAPATAQRIEIRAVGKDTPITVIEILSPSNKRPTAYDAYVRKRRDLLRSPVHLLELDLLRHGQRWPLATPLPDAPGFVVLSRAEARPQVDIWPLTLRESLPQIPVPLRPPAPDVTFDLAEAFAHVYELGAYDYRIDYRKDPPSPSLSPDDSAWVDEQLRAAGRR